MNSFRRITGSLAWIGLILSVTPVSGQITNPVTYTLLADSALIDDCLVCGRPPISYQLRGTFSLVPLDSNPLFTRYRLTNITFRTEGGPGSSYQISGNGEFKIGGEVAVVQEMTLDVNLNESATTFASDTQPVERRFPLVAANLHQTQTNLLQFFTLRLVAAPMREVWFSTASSFTSAIKDLHGSGGDVLSSSGLIVKSYSNLVANLNLLPNGSPPEIDAFDVGSAGEFFISFNANQSNAIPRVFRHGDLFSTAVNGASYANQTLLQQFGVMPVTPDVGLDAAIVGDKGDILFSIRDDVFSERLGVILGKGDLLSNAGQIVTRNSELLARFHPSAAKDYGLDALYIWPHGEIWFSVEEGFQDQQLGPVQAGVLLSSEGVIVYLNLELLSAFAPIEDLADFGLDGLFVVTDLAPSASPPRITKIERQAPSGTISLHWSGSGRVFQVERASLITGPYAPISPYLPSLSFEDAEVIPAVDHGFYRLRQW
jgi:hypothetical protein